MKFAVVVALAVLATVSAASIEDVNLSRSRRAIEGRIYNGTSATLGQFPYAVSLITCDASNACYLCSAVLIGQEWILTAAHCIHSGGQITIYLGAIDRNNAEVVVTVPASNAVVHPDWNPTLIHNDIAAVKMPAVTYSANIQPVTLPAYPAPVSTYENVKVYIMGWGATYDGSPFPTLQYSTAQALSQQTCSQYLDLIDSQICSSAKPAAVCGGDSGGPMVTADKKILIGIASFTVQTCGQTNYPSGYTRCDSYGYWIFKTTGIPQS